MVARRIERSKPRWVTLRVDGEDVPAAEGEPIAMSLLAAGRVTLGRSVKYHRPRGAACFAGRCDGCLMRVDGVPSVRTCAVPAREGTTLETQNVLGSAKHDLLAAADWFFPGGMNHHEMFTWARPVNEVMQRIAREIAGIGTLPDLDASVGTIEDASPDALVVGAGIAGLEAARTLGEAGLEVLLVDEEDAPGGLLRFVEGEAERARALADAARRAGVDLRSRHAALGLYDEPERGRLALVGGERGLLRVRARATLLATGRTEGAACFEGSDLPGVIGAEAATRLLAHDVLPGERIVLAGDLSTRRAELDALAAALRAAGAEVRGPLPLASVARAEGSASVEWVTLREGEGEREHGVDLLIAAPRTSASYELAVQAGARCELRDGVFEVVEAPRERHTWIAGALAGAASVEDAISSAAGAARAMIEALAARGESTP